MEFTYDAYTIMISELRRHGYQFADYRDHDKYDKCVILRHDVDYSLEKAYQLAALEYKLNVHSTYMILVSSGFYNIISKQTQEILKDILKMGHHIGLHFDEANYNTQDMNALKEYALEERLDLEELFLIKDQNGNYISSVNGVELPKSIKKESKIKKLFKKLKL